MHDLHLIHTDLKPENILLVSSDYVKVPDYKVLFSYSCSWFLGISPFFYDLNGSKSSICSDGTIITLYTHTHAFISF